MMMSTVKLRWNEYWKYEIMTSIVLSFFVVKLPYNPQSKDYLS